MASALACGPGGSGGPSGRGSGELDTAGGVPRGGGPARGSGAGAREGRAGLPPHVSYPSLTAALIAVIPADARAIGFGELHARRDRAGAPSTIAALTAALPALRDRLSDLIIETWIVDPRDPTCGRKAERTTRRLEAALDRPAAVKSEIELLAEAARAGGVQPHAMTLTCADYRALTRPAAPPAGGAGRERAGEAEPDPVVMLGLVTRELTRIATSAIAHRDRQPGRRPSIALYGGALHNDRAPAVGVAEWSYAASLDLATGGRYLEVDLIAPELAEQDSGSRAQPWFPLVAATAPSAAEPLTGALVWTRGERSVVVILPRAAALGRP
jgi:hypothetical protein